MSNVTEDQVYREMGQRIRARRESMRLTQQQLARKVQLTRTSVTNIEQGRQKIQVHTLYLIAAVLEIEPSLLLPEQRAEKRPAFDEMLLAGRDAEESAFVRRVMANLRGTSDAPSE